MRKGLFIAMVFLLAVSSNLMAAENYEKEVSAQNEELARTATEIEKLNQELKQLKIEYVNADIKLRQEIIAETSGTSQTKGDEKPTKATVRMGKEKQAELRKDYYEKKRPLAAKMNELKTEQALCKRRIKALERKIKKIGEGNVGEEEYIGRVSELRQQIDKAREELNLALGQLRKETDDKIAAIPDKETRAQVRRQIMTESKEKEIALWKDFNQRKQQIGEQMRQVKSEYRAIVRARHEEIKKKETEELAQKQAAQAKEMASGKCGGRKGPAYNFGPGKRR